MDAVSDSSLAEQLELVRRGGATLDINKIGRRLESDRKVWVLFGFVPGVDYADYSSGEQLGIWSIGRCKTSGKVYASLDSRFVEDASFECLWVR